MIAYFEFDGSREMYEKLNDHLDIGVNKIPLCLQVVWRLLFKKNREAENPHVLF